MKEFITKDILYRKVDSLTLRATIYLPEQAEPIPFVVDVHGGAWGGGDRFNNQVIHRSFAKNGIGVFAIDFRLSSQAPFPHPIADANYGVRWFKKYASTLGIKPSLIGGFGSSSGAQQNGLVALQPDKKLYCEEHPDLREVDAKLDFFIGAWPILDPLARYQMAKTTGKDRLIQAHHSYFPNAEDMTTGNPYLVVSSETATHMPQMAIIQGVEDENVDHFRADMFAELYCKMGGIIQVHKFSGQPHAFVTSNPSHPDSLEAIEKLQDFIFSLT